MTLFPGLDGFAADWMVPTVGYLLCCFLMFLLLLILSWAHYALLIYTYSRKTRSEGNPECPQEIVFSLFSSYVVAHIGKSVDGWLDRYSHVSDSRLMRNAVRIIRSPINQAISRFVQNRESPRAGASETNAGPSTSASGQVLSHVRTSCPTSGDRCRYSLLDDEEMETNETEERDQSGVDEPGDNRFQTRLKRSRSSGDVPDITEDEEPRKIKRTRTL